MNTLYLDSKDNDANRRQRLYSGPVFVFSPRPRRVALCDIDRAHIYSQLNLYEDASTVASRAFEIFAEGSGNTFGLELDAEGRLYSGHNGGQTRGWPQSKTTTRYSPPAATGRLVRSRRD